MTKNTASVVNLYPHQADVYDMDGILSTLPISQVICNIGRFWAPPMNYQKITDMFLTNQSIFGILCLFGDVSYLEFQS